MTDNPRRDLLKKAAALSIGAIASASSVFPRAGRVLEQADQKPAGTDFFPGFKKLTAKTSGATINFVTAGNGPGLLLLHGYPQSHIEWRRIAQQLAQKFTVVAADLRGYGDSSKPPDGENHFGYSKRATAQDQVEVMASLGFQKFSVVGHDRGGRVAHRMALDHPDRVTKVAVLDIVPTYKLFHNVTKEWATSSFHWFFLIQQAPFPETVIGNSAEFWLKSRAGASIDLDHDDADRDRKISCPLLALWGEHGDMHRLYNVLDTWRERASNVSGKPVPSGHFIAEEIPDILLAELNKFLS